MIINIYFHYGLHKLTFILFFIQNFLKSVKCIIPQKTKQKSSLCFHHILKKVIMPKICEIPFLTKFSPTSFSYTVLKIIKF